MLYMHLIVVKNSFFYYKGILSFSITYYITETQLHVLIVNFVLGKFANSLNEPKYIL